MTYKLMLQTRYYNLPITIVHDIKCLIDIIDAKGVSNKLIHLESAFLIFLNETRHFGSALDTTKSRSLPDATGNQLEWTSGDLFTSSCYTNNDGFTPSLVASLKSGTHDLCVASAVESVVEAAVSEVNQNLLNGLVLIIVGIDEFGDTKFSGNLFFVGIDINTNNTTTNDKVIRTRDDCTISRK